MDNEENKTIFQDKNGLTFARIKKNHYSTSFKITNNNILLPTILTVDIIDLIYKLNSDIYEYVKLTKISETEAELLTVTKHFFKDLGLPQRYSHLKIVKKETDHNITFEATSIISANKPEGVPPNAEQFPVSLMKTTCVIINPHMVSFIQSIQLSDKSAPIPPFMEKMLGNIMKKIFTRVKLFIEKIV